MKRKKKSCHGLFHHSIMLRRVFRTFYNCLKKTLHRMIYTSMRIYEKEFRRQLRAYLECQGNIANLKNCHATKIDMF